MSTSYTGTYTKVSTDAFKKLQLNAGMLLTTFDPAKPATIKDTDIICATSGGIQVSCVPTYNDLGEDVDNVPSGILELMNIQSWEAKMSFTALNITTDVLKLSLGAADVTSATNLVTPRSTLATSDAQTVWWVGDMNDGGFAAVKLSNALSSGGLSLQTSKDSKGQLTVELTGHTSISAQSTVPMEFYVVAGAA